MFKYTKASLNLLYEDIKKYSKIAKIISLAFTFLFAIYHMIIGLINHNNTIAINIVMAFIVIVYVVLEIVFGKVKLKAAEKISTLSFKITKILIQGILLGITLFDIYKTPSDKLSGISIILATLTIILWVISIVIEIVSEIVKKKSEEFIIALKTDYENLMKPITTVTDTFKKISGNYKKPEENPKKEKILNKLNEKIKGNKDK